MTQAEKKLCDRVLEKGEIIQYEHAKSVEGESLTFYQVLYDGEIYHLTLCEKEVGPDEWIYFFHAISA